ncbi:MAG: HAMP domain-containing sensor histidine kinase [Bacteroidales bacterium]|nr:HAMP domain-containing sensor histidine kinase [Bacteroidales bacterium]MDD3860920.1 HAMP domain-containing sensor histidine kinase [Bacteroidales bacterium]
MKKKRMITGIVLLMAISLITIILLQTIHLVKAYNKSKEMIDRGVSEAISRTLITLQKHDAIFFVYDRLNQNNKAVDSIFPIDPYMTQLGLNPAFTQISGNSMQIQIHSYPGSNSDKMTYSFYSGSSDLSSVESYMCQQFSDNEMEFDQIVMQLETEFMQRQIPIEKRFNSATVTDILRKSLLSMGLDLNFEFAITDDNLKVKLSSENFDIDKINECYKFNMMPGSLFSNPDILMVHFPTKKQYTLQSIYAQLATSVFLVLIFIITFGITFYALIKQKKLSEVKNDFINNMTHEFKTPIATIKLAAASLKSEKTVSKPAVMANMLDIITQETNRMNSHVEQVLQMAVLDKQNLEIKKQKENINELITDSANNIEIIVKEKGGNIILELCKEDAILSVDRDLISNVFNNLLDNAVKYSHDAPEINVKTYFKSNKFNISISDNGIGMNKEVTNKIFDKFYRAPTGNIHNIKGFGLGLNYAREIVVAHKGTITVKSSPGKGSTFTVTLPLK